MNNIFKIISTILMIILILVLMSVLINYYKDEPVSNISPNIINQSNNMNNVISNEKNDGNNTVILPNNEKNPNDIKNNNDNENFENGNEREDDKQPIENNDPVIITSSEQTSNAEKQEVLTEIDKTLMELLKVVDKVQTVDETRLGIDESEVQP